MGKRTFLGVTLGVFSVLAALGACSASKHSAGAGGFGGSGGTTTTSTGTGHGGASSVDSVGAFANGVGGTGSGGGQMFGCSADLKQVIDANGTVLMTCPPDQGCAGGVCVPACEAASKSHGNVGCDFMMSTPHFFPGCCGFQPIAPPCFAAFVTNNWDKDAKVEVTRGNMMYDATQFGRLAQVGTDPTQWPPIPATGVPPGQVGVLFLSDDPSSNNAGNPLICPVQPAIRAPNGTAVWPGDGSGGTAIGLAWHVTTTVPVSTYDMVPFGGASSFLPSASLVFPTSAWGTNYVAVQPPPSMGPPWAQIVATENNTTVKVLPTVNLPAGPNFPAAQPNMTAQYILNAGNYIQWQGPEMIGSIIQSDKPVAFVGGDGYQCYTSATDSGGGCDSGHQIIPPISALGSSYVAPPFASRIGSPESIPYLIVGTVDGTQLTFDPPVGGPSSINAGANMKFETTSPFTVKSQDDKHPFYIGQEMPGANCIGDEDFVNLMPPAQWLERYVFYTDYSYNTTNLVFVRSKGPKGFEDVTVDCAGGPLTGWQPVGASGQYEMTTFYLVNNGAPNGNCQNGPHKAESKQPFALMVWGLASCASYGYPAGGNAAVINQVVVPPTPK